MDFVLLAACFVVTAVVFAHILFYFVDPHAIRTVPGPFLAKFSDTWLCWTGSQGHRSEVVHQLHKKYGPFVRLAPNHVSVADPAAVQVVYAHGAGALKSDFYDAFVAISRSLLNTRDRAEHGRKRRILSHVFTLRSVLEFEGNVREYVSLFLRRWDALCEQAQAKEGAQGNDGEGGWVGRDGKLWLSCLQWFNYLAFDIIGDLAFGSPFGMIQAGRDTASAATSHDKVMSTYGSSQSFPTKGLPAIQILTHRSEYSSTVGVLPLWVRPIVDRLPWFARGRVAVEQLAAVAVAAVAKRVSAPCTRTDLLTKLQEWRDSEGRGMNMKELTAEVMMLLGAGSDTISNTLGATVYHLAQNQQIQFTLQQELDEALGAPSDVDDIDAAVCTALAVRGLPYLDAVINEALRIHATSAMGLPRVVPAGGMNVLGRFLKEGTVVSVPTYSINRDENLFGDDANVFRPERWLEIARDEARANEIQRLFHPFSFGPRQCLGRNLATMEMQITIASIMRRYDIVLERPEKPFESREGFIRKPLPYTVGVERRKVHARK